MIGNLLFPSESMTYELAEAIRIDRIFNTNTNLDAFLEKYIMYKPFTCIAQPDDGVPESDEDIVNDTGFGD